MEKQGHIGIIGTGQIGGTLARQLAERGYAVSIAHAHGPETLQDFAAEIGARAVTVEEAAMAGEIVIVSIPMRAVPELPPGLFSGVPPEVIVIDTGNYYPSLRDGPIEDIDNGMLESEWVAQQLGRPVIKAFNTVGAETLRNKGQARGADERIAIPVAGDPSEARARVLELVVELGFDAVDVGGMSESFRQQPGTPVYGKELDALGVRHALAEADRNRVSDYRGDAEARASNTPPPSDDLMEVMAEEARINM